MKQSAAKLLNIEQIFLITTPGPAKLQNVATVNALELHDGQCYASRFRLYLQHNANSEVAELNHYHVVTFFVAHPRISKLWVQKS